MGLLQNIFMGFFAVSMLGGMAIVAAIINVVALIPGLSREAIATVSLLCTQFAWRVSLLFSPWISTTMVNPKETNKAYETYKKCLAKFDETKENPVFVLGNHTSFLDTILTLTCLPTSEVTRCRTYQNAALLKKPLLSSICWGCHHFPVHFKSVEDGKFTLDREKFAIVDKRVDAHLKNKGMIAFFPEGQINEKPETLLPFRYGGMKKALTNDACLFFLVTKGNAKVWPRSAPIGGFPGEVKWTFTCLAEDGCKKLVADVKKNKSKLKDIDCNKDSPDHVILANYCRAAMQDVVDDLHNDDNKKVN
eukprot:g2009.t1